MDESLPTIEQVLHSLNYNDVQDFIQKNFVVDTLAESGEKISLKKYEWLTQEYQTKDGNELGLSEVALDNLDLKATEDNQPYFLTRVVIGDDDEHEALLVYQQQSNKNNPYQAQGIITTFGVYYPFKNPLESINLLQSFKADEFITRLDTQNAVLFDTKNQPKLLADKVKRTDELFKIEEQQKGEFIHQIDDQVLKALEKNEISYVYQKGIGFIDGNDPTTRFIETSDFGAEKPFFGSCVCVVIHSPESKLTGVLHADTNTDIAQAMKLMKEKIGNMAEVSIVGGQNDVSEPILKEIRDEIKDNKDWSIVRLDILGDKNIKTRQVVVDASNGNVYNLQGYLSTDLKPWDFWDVPDEIVKREGQKNLSSEKIIVDVDLSQPIQ